MEITSIRFILARFYTFYIIILILQIYFEHKKSNMKKSLPKAVFSLVCGNCRNSRNIHENEYNNIGNTIVRNSFYKKKKFILCIKFLSYFFEWLSCSVSSSSEHNLGIGSITSYHHLVLTSTLSISQVTNIFDTVIYTFFCLIAYWPAIPPVLYIQFRLYTIYKSYHST